MSDSLSRNERDKRAFDALIVSNLLRDRDITNLDDLPELSESQRARMNAVTSDIVDQLWDAAKEGCLEECEALQEEALQEDAMQDEQLFAGANRADMDDETWQKILEARKRARDAIRKRKGKGDAKS
jgi:hypothetical protein